MKPIDKPFWDRLTEKQRWDSIVGLRGPDFGSSGTIKWFTTSVIRNRLSDVMRVGGQVNQDLGCVIVPTGTIFPQKVSTYPGSKGKLWKMGEDGISIPMACEHGSECEVCKTLQQELQFYKQLPIWDYTHWNCHIQEAAQELQIPIFQVEGKRWWEILSKRGLHAACGALIEYFNTERAGNPDAVKELTRHLTYLTTYVGGGW